MTDKAIIQGSLVDVRNVNQHKCVRMLIDVPAELAPRVMEAFGWPTMASPVPVAIARLQETARQQEKPKRSWSDIPRSQQAAMKCDDVLFRDFLSLNRTWPPEIGNDAADVVKHLCGVNSRKNLDASPEAAQRWDQLYGDFQMWKAGAAA